MIKPEPKEKAKQLITSFYTQKDSQGVIYCVNWSSAKSCAIKVVLEIMDALSVLPYGMEYLGEIDYWEAVREQIHKS
jgi:hypothetical protein